MHLADSNVGYDRHIQFGDFESDFDSSLSADALPICCFISNVCVVCHEKMERSSGQDEKHKVGVGISLAARHTKLLHCRRKNCGWSKEWSTSSVIILTLEGVLIRLVKPTTLRDQKHLDSCDAESFPKPGA